MYRTQRSSRPDRWANSKPIKDFWLWNVLGALIIVGPFVYMHKLSTAMNKLAENYNVNG